MLQLRPCTILAAGALLATTAMAPALADEKRQLGAHEHGAALLQFAVEGDAVEIVLEVPGEDIVGFEHAAETDEQKATVAQEQERLSDPLDLFALPAEAGCTVAAAEVELHQEGDHNAFEAEYALTCEDAGAITVIETRLFELYPTLEEIEVEVVTGAGQGAGELRPDAPSMPLPGTS